MNSFHNKTYLDNHYTIPPVTDSSGIAEMALFGGIPGCNELFTENSHSVSVLTTLSNGVEICLVHDEDIDSPTGFLYVVLNGNNPEVTSICDIYSLNVQQACFDALNQNPTFFDDRVIIDSRVGLIQIQVIEGMINLYSRTGEYIQSIPWRDIANKFMDIPYLTNQEFETLIYGNKGVDPSLAIESTPYSPNPVLPTQEVSSESSSGAAFVIGLFTLLMLLRLITIGIEDFASGRSKKK